MKQIKIILVGFIACISSIVVVNATPVHSDFEDDNFYKCVVNSYNNDNHATKNYETDILSDSELASIKNLICQFTDSDDLNDTTYDVYRVKSTKGLDKLVNLEYLSISGNGLTSLDVSHNVKLNTLELNLEKIATIDLKNNINMESLSISNVPISDINLENNTNLQNLYLSNTNIKELNLSQNINLVKIEVENNKIESIDLKTLNKLKRLDISKNNLSVLDVSKNTNLEILLASNNKLTNIDVTNNEKLNVLYLHANKLEKLDVSKNKNLTMLYAGENLTELDISNNIYLRSLYVASNKLTGLDLSKNINLENINISSNNLMSIDVSNLNYLNVIAAGNEKRNVSAKYVEGKYQISLKNYDNNIDPNKVIIEENDNIKYNKETGIITLNELVESINYEYKINDNNKMGVTLLLNKKGMIKLNVLDSTDNKVKGAVVGIYNTNKELVQKVETNEEGIATFEHIDLGNYYVHVIEVPEKYKFSDEWFLISLDKDSYDFNTKLEFTSADERAENPKTGFNEMTLALAIIAGGALVILKKKSKRIKLAKI